VFLAGANVLGVGLDVVLGKFDLAPLAGGEQFRGHLADRLGDRDALHQRCHAVVGQSERTDRRLGALDQTTAVELVEYAAIDALAGVECGKRRRFGVGVGIGVGIGGDRTAVDPAVPLAREVRERDVDGLAVETRLADDLPHLGRRVVCPGLDGGPVETDLWKFLVEILATFPGQFGRFDCLLGECDQPLRFECEGCTGRCLWFQVGLVGHRLDSPGFVGIGSL